MSSGEHLEMMGRVIGIERDKFKVQIENSETIIKAQIAGKLRLNKIRIILGDVVVVKVSQYDLTHGIISERR